MEKDNFFKNAFINTIANKKSKYEFTEYEENVFSQHGQDGVLKKLFSKINCLENITTFEVGGWDGVTLSNTCNLLKNHDAFSIFVEANKKKFEVLLKNHSKEIASGKVLALNEFLTPQGLSSPSKILKRAGISDLDFISIDVDGMDYFILRDLDISPKVILIEYNYTFHPNVEFVQPQDYKVNWGSSSSAVLKLAEKKGYGLVHFFETDLLLVRKDIIKNYNLKTIESYEVFSKANGFFGFGYDGTLLMFGDSKNKGPNCPWVSAQFSPTNFQFLPSFLRFFVSKKDFTEYFKWVLRNLYLKKYKEIIKKTRELLFRKN
tara:strand:- start:13718 stop:14674 length:957 start_codon:yes stop_codon:yes gene_type:complete